MLLKKRKGSAIANAPVFDSRHGPWVADLLVFHASRTDTPRWRSSRYPVTQRVK